MPLTEGWWWCHDAAPFVVLDCRVSCCILLSSTRSAAVTLSPRNGRTEDRPTDQLNKQWQAMPHLYLSLAALSQCCISEAKWRPQSTMRVSFPPCIILPLGLLLLFYACVCMLTLPHQCQLWRSEKTKKKTMDPKRQRLRTHKKKKKRVAVWGLW